MYAKIYTNSAGSVKCKISERKKVKGVFKRRKLEIGDLVDESFKGSCVIKVYQVYVVSSGDRTKTPDITPPDKTPQAKNRPDKNPPEQIL